MDTSIDNTVRACKACENSEKTHPKSPYQTTAIPRPTKPWENLAIDVTGPFATAPSNCKYAVVLIDYYSSYPQVLWTKEATTETVSNWLSEVFACFGNPISLRSDNGPQFTSIAFTNFLANRGIRHQRTPNYNPEQNGLVERFNGTLNEPHRRSLQIRTGNNSSWNSSQTSARPLYSPDSPRPNSSSVEEILVSRTSTFDTTRRRTTISTTPQRPFAAKIPTIKEEKRGSRPITSYAVASTALDPLKKVTWSE